MGFNNYFLSCSNCIWNVQLHCNFTGNYLVGYLPSDHDSALFVANAKDMFQKEGLKISLVPFRSGPDLINAAKLGKIDIGYCGIYSVTMAINDGAPIKIVASVN